MSDWVNIGIGAGGFAGVLGVVGPLMARQFAHSAKRVAIEVITKEIDRLEKKFEQRFDSNDASTQSAADKATHLELELARQFGGNGGGLREAVNRLSTDVAHIKGALSTGGGRG